MQSLQDLKNYHIVFLLYPAGTSGEFLANALSCSLPEFFKSSSQWENNSRVKFEDCFDRSFNGADDPVSESRLVQRFEDFVNRHQVQPSQTMIALAHNHDFVLDYIQTHFDDSAVIEITTHTSVSQKFRDLAATEKIGPKTRNTNLYKDCGQVFRHHLRVEWQDLFLTGSHTQYNRICSFLNRHGNYDQFDSMLQDYKQRNRSLTEQLHES